ncbi:nitroreductase family deazaflavin-dependent oxidoreductase [Streptomyces enissocaesilis]|uniref:Nitroreductase/quinone reductase family protein n=1 Tax=Streptomyces enissocaesilis TaxID=332589 RepID=A0ABP6K9G9_9ACTN
MSTAIKIAQRVMSGKTFRTFAPSMAPALDRLVFRLTRGKRMFLTSARPEVGIMLTTVGARSGGPRTTPLVCMPEGPDGPWIVVGSNFGKAHHPAWTANLIKTPRATIGWKGRSHTVEALLLQGAEREATWQAVTESWPPYAVYQQRSGRQLRLFRLRPLAPVRTEQP